MLYQTVCNAFFFEQSLTTFQVLGVSFGILATLMITLGDELVKRCRDPPAKLVDDADNDKDFLKVSD